MEVPGGQTSSCDTAGTSHQRDLTATSGSIHGVAGRFDMRCSGVMGDPQNEEHDHCPRRRTRSFHRLQCSPHLTRDSAGVPPVPVATQHTDQPRRPNQDPRRAARLGPRRMSGSLRIRRRLRQKPVERYGQGAGVTPLSRPHSRPGNLSGRGLASLLWRGAGDSTRAHLSWEH
jgi:hypothetical protein